MSQVSTLLTQAPNSKAVEGTKEESKYSYVSQHLEGLTDPQGVQYPFISIVMIGFLATIGGAQGWEDMENYGISHEPWLSKLLPLPQGIPKADTYRRLFQRLSATAWTY